MTKNSQKLQKVIKALEAIKEQLEEFEMEAQDKLDNSSERYQLSDRG